MEVTIIGAGIVGLALALALDDRGIECRIFEAAPQLREIGVGITLLPHAVRELAALGLQDELLKLGVETEKSAFYNRFGQLLYSEPRGRLAGYPFPELAIHRGRLHGLLYQTALRRLGAARIITDHQLSYVTQDDRHVALTFRQTSTEQALGVVAADFVVACDGVNSNVRKALCRDDALKFTGINTWRGVTRHKPILSGKTYFRVGSIRTGKMVIYPISNDLDENGLQLINWVAEIERPSSQRNDWNAAGKRTDVLPIYQGWNFDWLSVPDLIERAETVFEYPMVDKDPISQWTFGRITLAGDAAHPMYPRGSNGSAQGLIDARTIADLLAGGGDPRQSFIDYEKIRGPVTARIVETNRTTPPDVINLRVEDLTGDRPFDNLDDFISQAELRELSDQYKRVAGFEVNQTVA